MPNDFGLPCALYPLWCIVYTIHPQRTESSLFLSISYGRSHTGKANRNSYRIRINFPLLCYVSECVCVFCVWKMREATTTTPNKLLALCRTGKHQPFCSIEMDELQTSIIWMGAIQIAKCRGCWLCVILPTFHDEHEYK